MFFLIFVCLYFFGLFFNLNIFVLYCLLPLIFNYFFFHHFLLFNNFSFLLNFALYFFAQTLRILNWILILYNFGVLLNCFLLLLLLLIVNNLIFDCWNLLLNCFFIYFRFYYFWLYWYLLFPSLLLNSLFLFT